MGHFLKVFLLVFVTFSSRSRHSTLAANLGGCKLTLEDGSALDETSWTFDHTVPKQLKDTSVSGDVVYTYGCEEVDSITKGESTQPSPGVDYVTYQLSADKKQLTVVVAAAFRDYEKNEVTAGLTLNTPVTFQCKGGSSDLKFRVNVELSNNNEPIFGVGTEDLMTLSMPYPNGLRVTTITLTDIDLGNEEITLTMDAAGEENFQIMAPRVTGKVYEFDLKTRKQIYLESLLQVVVTAKDNSQGVQKQAVARLKFEPDLVLSTPPTPRFSEALSVGDVSDETAVGSVIPVSPAITFSEGFDSDEVAVTISNVVNADSSLFEVKMVGGAASIVLKAALPEAVLKEAFVILVLQAERSGAANTGRTVVHLALPLEDVTTTTPGTTQTTTECPPTVTCPTTDEPTTCPECPTDGTTPTTTDCPTVTCPTLPTDCPVTCEECPTDGTTQTTTECPTVTCSTLPTDCPVTCEECPTDGTSTSPTTCPTLPTDCPVTCEECPTECSTSPGTTESSSTCPVCPTDCPETSIGTECPTTTPGVDEGTLGFEQDDYQAEISPGFTGIVLKVAAKADPARPVTYTLETTSTVIGDRVTVDTLGNVNANRLPPGTFAFTVSASVAGTSLYAFAKVTIKVGSTSLCGEEPQFEYALAVISIVEEVEQIVIPGLTTAGGTDCVYTLDSNAYFSIDAATGALTSKRVDRESEMFVDMATPQVSVNLNVKCASKNPARSLHAQLEDNRHGNMSNARWAKTDARLDYSEIESVESSYENMKVVAIIEDVNDNAPIFVTPNPLVVGYPSEDLMAQLNPTLLATAKATDSDMGINAEVEYSLDPATPTGRFYVHPKSGSVYVLASEFTFTDQEINVLATDMAGEGLTSQQPLNIKVKVVYRDEVTEVLIEGALLEQEVDVLEAMSLATGFEVRSFSSSVVPSPAVGATTTPASAADETDEISHMRRHLAAVVETSRPRRDLAAADETNQALLRMIVYAIDKQQQVVLSDEFKTQMQDFDSWVVQAIRQLESNSEPSDNSGLVAAVIALGVIVAVLLIAAGVVFFIFYLRPRMGRDKHLQDLINNGYEDSMSDATSSAESKDEDVEADDKANITSWLHVAGDSNDKPESTAKGYSNELTAEHVSQDTALNMEGSSHILSQFVMPGSNLEAYNSPMGGNVRMYPGDSDSEDDEVKPAAADEFGTRKKAERKKSVVTFNESVDCIEIEKM